MPRTAARATLTCAASVLVLASGSGCARSRSAYPVPPLGQSPETLRAGERADDVAPACPPPAVDTTAWQRVTSAVAPVSFLLPRGWQRADCGAERRAVEVWCQAPDGDEITVVTYSGAPEVPRSRPESPHPVLQFSACQETVSGHVVWIAAGRPTGYGRQAQAWAGWPLSPDRYVAITGATRSRDGHERALMVLRTVRVEQD